MLDAFIIEEIKRRERLRQERERPSVELPVPSEDGPHRKSDTDDTEKPQRGVVVLDLLSR
jgi:hypothetical protein